ncbi:MAG: menaquinone biosynthesis protein [Fimbriimonadaceae bacterium]|nr:menaquinone biosynthesis protein [Chthonomonadaceae bacterium]MCO5295746.1 menaquinone biosynthesis protein [Fimbriimonadaceae bacterium]
MRCRIGCVPFVNAKPLIARFLDEDRGIDVALAPPSQLPAMLDRGEAAAVLASSFDALRTPGRRVAAGVSISSYGPAESVRVFSKVPFDRAQSLALDASSLTSNALAQILLHELHGVCPRTEVRPPDLTAMLGEFDAAVLIGDRGLSASSEGLHVLDLGQGWTELTELPFVWALWIGQESLTPALAGELEAARHWGEERVVSIAARAAQEAGWKREVAEIYLTQNMRYGFEEEHVRALVLFGHMLEAHGLIDRAQTPEIVAAIQATRAE